MDPKLLDYYNRDLASMRTLAAGFAQANPKIARRLGVRAGEISDPYVERLIESFCLLSARTQIKIDAEFPRFTERLLEVIYPNYIAPTPSMSVARIYPNPQESSLTEGVHLPRGSRFRSRIPNGEKTVCQFVSGQDVTLYPLEVVEARLTGVPSDIASLGRYVPAEKQVRGALRLRLRTSNAARIADLQGLERLPIYVAGDEAVASHLFELLHVASVATIIGEPGQFGSADNVLSAVITDAVVHEGLGIDQGLLPLAWSKFHGHNLLHEYFACPSRFYFFTLTGLAPALHRVHGSEVEIVVLLDQMTDQLAPLVDASRFELFCTPVINLFRKRTDQSELSWRHPESKLVVSRLDPTDYEVFSVEHIYGQQSQLSEELEFRPLYRNLNSDEGNYGRYFSARRERRLMSDAVRQYGMRTSYVGTEMFVSLVDQRDAPHRENIRYFIADAWLTNRDLPLLIPRDGVDDLMMVSDEDAIGSIGLIRPPSAPRSPFFSPEMVWRLIRQLNFDSLPFSDREHREGGQGLRDLLRLFLSADNLEGQRQIQSLVGAQTHTIRQKLPGNGPLVFGRGTACVLTVDENGFAGSSPYLLGLILEHYLARHVSMNSFTRTELRSMQRGLVARWPVCMGGGV